MYDIAVWSVTGLVIVRMVIAGFLVRSDALFSWPMFSRSSFCYLHLRGEQAGRVVPVNQWDYLISADASMTEAGARRLLQYLNDVHGVVTNGFIVVVDEHGEHRRDVYGGHVVD